MNTASIKPKSQVAQQLTKLLSHYPNIKLAILFGSQASSDQQKHFGSDIDLAILATEPLSGNSKQNGVD